MRGAIFNFFFSKQEQQSKNESLSGQDPLEGMSVSSLDEEGVEFWDCSSSLESFPLTGMEGKKVRSPLLHSSEEIFVEMEEIEGSKGEEKVRELDLSFLRANGSVFFSDGSDKVIQELPEKEERKRGSRRSGYSQKHCVEEFSPSCDDVERKGDLSPEEECSFIVKEYLDEMRKLRKKRNKFLDLPVSLSDSSSVDDPTNFKVRDVLSSDFEKREEIKSLSREKKKKVFHSQSVLKEKLENFIRSECELTKEIHCIFEALWILEGDDVYDQFIKEEEESKIDIPRPIGSKEEFLETPSCSFRPSKGKIIFISFVVAFIFVVSIFAYLVNKDKT